MLQFTSAATMASQSHLDVEDESILSTIFKDSFPESWRDHADFAQYLSELSSYGVDKLNREPDRLAEERASILQQTQDLAFHNYKTFIQTAECSRDILKDFQIIESHVDSMLQKLPDLSSECQQFMKTAQDLNVSRRVNTVTLARHTQLLEVLEIPQLMDTCVRNGYYEEALELAAHVKRLEKKHPNITIIQNIVAEVRGSSQLMLTHLIQQLRTNVQLPACLRVIGYLRRMDVLTEAELRIKFLQARDTWFQGILQGIPMDDAYYHITKVIEASRVHLFDIITQYRAIFSDDDPLMGLRDDSMNESTLFHGWVVQKVSQFISTLEHDLHRGVGGRLDSLLGQCMYFGLSFSRVGADFRGLLAPIFQRAALAGFTHSLAQANQRYEESMQSYTLLSAHNMMTTSAYSLTSQQTSGSLQPPTSLLEFQPMAAYCNQVLSAFNDLRLCAPLSLACDVAKQLQDSLIRAVEVVLAYHRAEEATFSEDEEGRFGELCRVMVEELVPHLNLCMQAIFPPAQLAQILGVPVSDLHTYGNIGCVDISLITKSVVHLVPVRIEEPVAEISEEPAKDIPSSLKDATASATEAVHDGGSKNVDDPASGTEAVDDGGSKNVDDPASGTEAVDDGGSKNVDDPASATEAVHDGGSKNVDDPASGTEAVHDGGSKNVDDPASDAEAVHDGGSKNVNDPAFDAEAVHDGGSKNADDPASGTEEGDDERNKGGASSTPDGDLNSATSPSDEDGLASSEEVKDGDDAAAEENVID